MKADGSIIIDTKIVDGGMKKGFEFIKDEMASVGIAAKRVGEQVQLSFSKMDVSKPIANAFAKVQQLEQQLASVTSEFRLAVADGDDKVAERLAAKRISVYDQLAAAREKLSVEIASAVQREAEAEEKASQRAIKAAEKEAAAKKKAEEKQFNDLTRPARRFNSRLREIVSGALVFNVISASLRRVTSYFGTALQVNQEYSNSLAILRGSLLTAFQPVYEVVIPAIVTLINWLSTAAQVIGRFFAAISGKNYDQMRKNAQALNKQAGAIGGVGDAAEEAAKQLAGFDEINRLESMKTGGTGGSGGGGTSPLFETIEIPSDWETVIDSLAMRVKDIFFEWDNFTPEIIAEKLIAGLSIITGGLIGFALGGPSGALIGMTIGAGIAVVISSLVFDGDGKLSTEEIFQSLVYAISIIGGGLIGFAIGGPAGAAIGATVGAGFSIAISKLVFDGDGSVSTQEMVKTLVGALAVIGGAAIGFAIGGPGGALVGAAIGLGVSFAILGTSFEEIEEKFNELKERISDWSNVTAAQIENNFIIPMKQGITDIADWIEEKFSQSKDWITNTWISLPGWFEENVTQPIVGFFNSLSDAVSRVWDNIVQDVINAVNNIVSAFGRVFGMGGQTQSTPATPSVSPRSYPQVPHLARGAVLPPNKPFLAMVGDQNSGTNVEAPLETIKQAVMEVLAQTGSGDIQINFTGDLAQLARILYPEIHRVDKNTARSVGR